VRGQGLAESVSKADNPSGVFLFLLRPRPTYPGIVEAPNPLSLSLSLFARFIGCRRGLSSWLLPARMKRRGEGGLSAGEGGRAGVMPEGCEAAATCWRDNVLALRAAPRRRSSPALPARPPSPSHTRDPPPVPPFALRSLDFSLFLPRLQVVVIAGRAMRFSARVAGWI